jgi:hypothetical protein
MIKGWRFDICSNNAAERVGTGVRNELKALYVLADRACNQPLQKAEALQRPGFQPTRLKQ